MNSDSKFVKQPRAVRTRGRLLTALERLLREREFEQIGIADIAKEAGVAVGSVYSHFRDKTAFLEALLEQRLRVIGERLAESEATGTDAEVPDDLASGVQLAVRSAFSQVMEDAHILRALHTYARLRGSAHPAAEALAVSAFQGVRRYLDRFADEIRVHDPEEAAKIFNTVLNTVFSDRVMLRGGALPAAITPSDESLLQAVAFMLTAYLRGGSVGGEGTA